MSQRRCNQSPTDPQIASSEIPTDAPESLPAEWLALEDCPLGTPVQVTDGGGERCIAIRDPYEGWLNATRSAPIPFAPTGWAPLE